MPAVLKLRTGRQVSCRRLLRQPLPFNELLHRDLVMQVFSKPVTGVAKQATIRTDVSTSPRGAEHVGKGGILRNCAETRRKVFRTCQNTTQELMGLNAFPRDDLEDNRVTKLGMWNMSYSKEVHRNQRNWLTCLIRGERSKSCLPWSGWLGVHQSQLLCWNLRSVVWPCLWNWTQVL